MTAGDTDMKSLENLKQLLLGPEQNKIKSIENRLDNPLVRAEEISDALPDAVSLSVNRSDKLAYVIQPVLDNALKVSVRTDPKCIADAIFPALGPGIRKAITATIMGMIQSLNQVLNHSFSLQGLKWRFEAFKSGKSFAEVVLLNTLVFQVEQIFLIHKDTGIVLEHVVAENAIIQDPDLVSGMLTAIRDFVRDSFSTTSEEELETLRIGSDRTVWIEKGEHALIAAVLRGTPPLELRIQYQELLEEIHLKAGKALEKFTGDTSVFVMFTESLKLGLKSKAKTRRKKISPLLPLLFTVLFCSLFYIGFEIFESRQAKKMYLDTLSVQKGIVVVSVEKKNSSYYISGLKDPLAVDPESLLTDQQKKRLSMEFNWQPYFCLDPQMVLKRAQDILAPPSSVSLSLLGVTLAAKGEAGYNWIDRFKKRAPSIPGVQAYDIKEIICKEQIELENAAKVLSGIRIYFENNRAALVKDQEKQLNRVLNLILKIQTIQEKVKTLDPVVIIGHTDSSGSEKQNLRLSRSRAETVFNFLLLNKVNPVFLRLTGIGTQMPLAKENSMMDRQYNRAVSFQLFVTNSVKDM